MLVVILGNQGSLDNTNIEDKVTSTLNSLVYHGLDKEIELQGANSQDNLITNQDISQVQKFKKSITSFYFVECE